MFGSTTRSESGKIPNVTSGTGDLRVFDLNKDVADHIYSVLPIEAIRLLCLHPGSRSQTIKCTLSTIQLTNVEPYEALSYVWGSEADPETLLLDCHEFSITKNLHSALCALRLPDKDRFLWIDALCINQNNDAEKGTQIPLMGSIYERAVQVIAWLGSPTDDMMSPGWGIPRMTSNGIKFYFPPKDNSLGEARTDINPERLLNCDYWDRAWIVQEIAFARSLRLQCGHFSMSYDDFRSVLDFRDAKLEGIVSADPSAGNVTIVPTPFRMSWIQPGSGPTNPISVKQFLDRLVEKKCGDPRDSIFAFYNLFSQELQKQLPSPRNYCQQPQDVLLKAICAMISSDRSLYAITVRSRQKTPNGENNAWQLDLPSWCPYVRTPFEIDSLSELGEFNFGTETTEQFFQSDGKLIRVRGYAIAIVSRTLPQCRHLDLENKGGKYSDQELDYIIRYYSVCSKFGLQLPFDQRHGHKDLRETPSLLEAFRHGIATFTKNSNSSTFSDIDLQLREEAIYYWQRTHPRQVCKFIALDGGGDFSCSTGPARWDDNDLNWVDLEDSRDAALVPATCDVGDIIAGIVGCALPVVVRVIPGDSGLETVYRVVGEAYIRRINEYVAKTSLQSFILR
jgi:hypothetical protein